MKTRLVSGGKRTRLTLKTKSDPIHKEWSDYILTRDGRTCQHCGRQSPRWRVDAAHIFSRGSAPRLRYDVMNGVTLCFLCHRWYDTHKGTMHDGEADRWVRHWLDERFVGGQYGRLLLKKSLTTKRDTAMEQVRIRAAMQSLLEGQRG